MNVENDNKDKKIILNKNSFKDAMRLVCSIVQKKSPTPALNHIRLEIKNNQLKIIGTNSEFFIIKKLICENSQINITYTINAHVFNAILKGCGGDKIFLSSKFNDLIIHDNNTSFSILNTNFEDEIFNKNFENLEKKFTIKLSLFKDLLERISLPLEGLLQIIVKEKTFVMLVRDRSRMSFINISSEILDMKIFHPGIINLNPSIIPNLMQLCDENDQLLVASNEKEYLFQTETTDILCKSIAGSILDLNKILDCDDFFSIVLNTEEVVDALKKLSTITSSINKILSIVFQIDNNVFFKVFNPNIGQANRILTNIENLILKSEISIKVNIEYLLDAFLLCKEKTTKILFKNSEQKLILMNKDAIHLILPIKIT